jgi:DNA mismatch endonuclease (patch repair protein)
MTDMFSPEKRSEIMSRIRSKETQAEKLVFSYLRKHKIYFQKHYKKAPGKPDIALPRKKKAVFIDGDFWHGRDYARVTANRQPDDYWVLKIRRNMERDTEQRQYLLDNGWQLLAIWESDIKRVRTRQASLDSIAEFLLAE